MRAAALALALLALLAAPAAAVRVLVIGIDGLGGDWLATANAPVMKGLVANGTATLQMQNVIGTSSSQNWFSMVGGAGPDQHGVYTNGWERGDSVQTPSMFAVLREQMPLAKIGAFYHWSGFGRLIEDEPVLDIKQSPGNERQTTDAAIAWAKVERPDMLFIHLDHVDGAGHGSYWGSPTYFEAIEYADQLVGEVVEAYRSVGLWDDTVILICSDHGGGQTGGHGRDAQPFRNIPFIVSGFRVNNNQTIEREVRVYDLSATAIAVLGLRAPDSWIATPVYEALRGYVPPSPPAGELRVQLVNQFTRVYDTSGEINVALQPHSIWRPVAPAGYVSLGDVVVQGYDAPTYSVPVVFDDGVIVRQPIAFERIWTNAKFFMRENDVTLWQPLPQYGDVCIGTFAAADGSDKEPPRSSLRCVNAFFAIKGEGVSAARNAGYSDLEYGFWMSLWEAVSATGSGLATHSFIARRDLNGPGYNKFYVLDTSKAVVIA